MIGCRAYTYRRNGAAWVVYWIARPDVELSAHATESDASQAACDRNAAVLRAQESALNARTRAPSNTHNATVIEPSASPAKEPS